jgi:hypothetical protein
MKIVCTRSVAFTRTKFHDCRGCCAENLEPWQVMQYGPSEKYTRHVDFYDRDERFFGNDVEKFGGQRIKTALLYLTDAEGGETVFPKSLVNNTAGVASCAGRCASWLRICILDSDGLCTQRARPRFRRIACQGLAGPSGQTALPSDPSRCADEPRHSATWH